MPFSVGTFACAKCDKTLADGSTGSGTILASQDLGDGKLHTLQWCHECARKVLGGVNAAAWRAAQPQAAKAAAKPKAKARKRPAKPA